MGSNFGFPASCGFFIFFQVSWIRKADLHVLTSDVLTFTGDQRFSAHHPVDTDAWTLQIKYTQLRDAGEYQCQVNTEPKISFSVFLQVEGNLNNNLSSHDNTLYA